jgi:hypothetical protein
MDIIHSSKIPQKKLFFSDHHRFEVTKYEIMLIYHLKVHYLPFRFPPIFRKHAAPWFRYAGSSAKGIPFKLERNGRSRKTKRACRIQDSRFSTNKRNKIL